jgi:hypothetical protein
MKQTCALVVRQLTVYSTLALLCSVTSFAAPAQQTPAVSRVSLTERSWRLDRAGMFGALVGRSHELVDSVEAMYQIGTMAGIDLRPAADAAASLENDAKIDANSPPARPSDADVLALKTRFDEALIKIDRAMTRFDVGLESPGSVTSTIMSAAAILRADPRLK